MGKEIEIVNTIRIYGEIINERKKQEKTKGVYMQKAVF